MHHVMQSNDMVSILKCDMGAVFNVDRGCGTVCSEGQLNQKAQAAILGLKGLEGSRVCWVQASW